MAAEVEDREEALLERVAVLVRGHWWFSFFTIDLRIVQALVLRRVGLREDAKVFARFLSSVEVVMMSF